MAFSTLGLSAPLLKAIGEQSFTQPTPVQHIDIQQLPVVINYELPRSPKDYIHRIGRTGRAGISGRAISLVCPEDQHHFGIIQKKMGKKVEILESEGIDLHGF